MIISNALNLVSLYLNQKGQKTTNTNAHLTKPFTTTANIITHTAKKNTMSSKSKLGSCNACFDGLDC
jgi:hypothetical protein